MGVSVYALKELAIVIWSKWRCIGPYCWMQTNFAQWKMNSWQNWIIQRHSLEMALYLSIRNGFSPSTGHGIALRIRFIRTHTFSLSLSLFIYIFFALFCWLCVCIQSQKAIWSNTLFNLQTKCQIPVNWKAWCQSWNHILWVALSIIFFFSLKHRRAINTDTCDWTC